MSNQDQITADLAAAGFSSVQIAGVEGNLQVESGFNPSAINAKEGAHGIAQWEGGRWTALQQYAAAHGTPWNDVNTQVGFLVSELQGPESAAMSGLSQATTPAQAATVFDRLFERSSAASLPARITAAQNIAAGGVQGGSGVAAGPGSAGPNVQNAGLLSGVWDGFLHAMAPVGRLVVDAGLVLLGATAIIAGVVIMAKATDHSTPAVALPGAAGEAPEEEGPRHKGTRAGAEGDAADAAEVAAV